MNKRAVLYARVSGDDRKREGRNLEGQVAMGREYAQEKGYQVIAELAEDDRGASGASWDLPMMNQALDMARENAFDVLVTRELDRFARGLAKQLVIEGEFKRHGVEIDYILGEYPDTPEGQLNKNIRAVIAEFEREKINQRMTRGRRLVVKNGKVMLHGNKPPYGYRVEDRMLVICESEAGIVRLIFTWYTSGERLSIRAVARKLTGMNVPTKTDIQKRGFKRQGYGKWAAGTVGAILKNEVYAGAWHYGKRDHNSKYNARESWLPVEVPAVVSKETFEKAQERRALNRELASRNTKYEYLVGRRVVCGQCGNKMCGRQADRGKYRYYQCTAKTGHIASQSCDNLGFNVVQVDAAVWEWIRDLLLQPDMLRQKLKEQQAEQEQANKPLRDRLTVTDDLLADNQKQLERLLDLYLSGDFGKEMLTERKARLETTITALEKERAGLVMTLETHVLTDDQIQSIEDFAIQTILDLGVADWSFERQRKLIDDLDVQVTLAVEDGQKVAYVRCKIGEAALPIVTTTSRSGSHNEQIVLTARIVLDKPQADKQEAYLITLPIREKVAANSAPLDIANKMLYNIVRE